MMWLRADWHDANRSPDTISTSTLLRPALQAWSWAGSVMGSAWTCILAQEKEGRLCLTTVDAKVQRCGNGKWQESILVWVLQDGQDKLLKSAGLDNPGPVFVFALISSGFNSFFLKICYVPQSAQALPTRRRACLLRACLASCSGTADKTCCRSPESPSGTLQDAIRELTCQISRPMAIKNLDRFTHGLSLHQPASRQPQPRLRHFLLGSP